MSWSKSQVHSNLDETERTNTANSFYSELNRNWETQSMISTTTHDSYKAAFFNFMRDFKEKYKTRNYQHLIRRGSRRWHEMTEADRAPYMLEADRNRNPAKAKSKISTRKTQSNKKRQDTKNIKDNRSRNQRCPACGRRKKSRQRSTCVDSSSTSSISTQYGSSKSSKSWN